MVHQILLDITQKTEAFMEDVVIVSNIPRWSNAENAFTKSTSSVELIHISGIHLIKINEHSFYLVLHP